MNSTKVNNNRILLRDNSANGANNGDDIFSTIYERVLNIVGFDPDGSIIRRRYLTDHIVLNKPYKDLKNEVLNIMLNEPYEDLKNSALSDVPAPKYEMQGIKDTIKKCCDVYKSSVRDSEVIAIIDKICELIRNFYVANTESHNREISSGDVANKQNNAESKYIEVAKEIVECYDKLQNQISIIFWAKVLKNLPVESSSLNKKSINTIKSTVTSLLVGDAVSKFLSEAKTQHSRINYVAIKELLLSLQRKINPLKGTDTKVTKELIRDLFYGFGVPTSAWELQERVLEKLPNFSIEFGTINVNGKNFKIVDRGAEQHGNCAFLSLKSREQIFSSQTYNKDVKEYILKGAEKLKTSLQDESKNKKGIQKLLIKCLAHELSINLFEEDISNEIHDILATILKELNVDEFLNEFKEYKPEMFINGVDTVYSLLLAIGMEKRIVVVNRDNKISRIFDPEKGLLTSTESKSENKNEDAIYVCEVTGHMMKLEQVDNVGVYANKTDIYSAKEKILSAIKEKISNDEGQFYITRQYIKYAYEHFICADGSKCNDNELPQLRAAYDAITNQKLNSDEPNKQIAKLMSEALVEIAILRPLYWMDYAQKLGFNS